MKNLSTIIISGLIAGSSIFAGMKFYRIYNENDLSTAMKYSSIPLLVGASCALYKIFEEYTKGINKNNFL